MTVIVFEHDGWVVSTSAWTVASQDERSVTICYQWGGPGLGFFTNSVANAKAKLPIPMTKFLSTVIQDRVGVVDLRKLYAPG